MKMINDNIAAISTGLVASGVAVIRISGNSPLFIAEKIFAPNGKVGVKDFEPNKMYVGEISGYGFKDYGMCVYFKAPKSFTGEDVVEFHTHGGIAIAKGILNQILNCGARLATNGEFTKRAFINGKLSLSSAEGLIDMINGENTAMVKAGYSLYREKLTEEIKAMQNRLTDVLSQIDVDMDFPEENLERSSKHFLKKTVADILGEIDRLISSYRIGRVVKNGVKVAIVGKPNTGKSSIMNALLNYDKAIVSDVAGTTRDVVEGSIDIEGVRFNFFDTAGIRETQDKIENLGVGLSKKILNECDLVLCVFDAANFDEDDEKIFVLIKDKLSLVVVNKMDISDFKDERADVYISALGKKNLELLRQAIYNRTVGASVDLNGDFLCEERHLEALKCAKQKLELSLDDLEKVSLDILAINIKDGWDALGEITGLTATEEIIDNIFKKFCVGK